jgi:site-specific recombinase XerD
MIHFMEAEKEYFINLFLDTRRELRSHKYPVKLRVFTPFPRKQKLYQTKFEYTEKEFQSIWETTKPREESKLKRVELQVMLDQAEEVASRLKPFTFENFEKAIYQKKGDDTNVFYHYQLAIKRYKENRQFGTASNYDLSVKAIKNFLANKDLTKKKKEDSQIQEPEPEPDFLLFREITPSWLTQFENYLLEQKRSYTTVGIYLRPLRAIFNSAISEKIIDPALYPFGGKRYEIPKPRVVKKALTKEQLKTFFEAITQIESQKIAKDYWFFLYNCAGLNIKDMLGLKYKNLHDNKLVYIREKTKRTSKANLMPVVVYLNEYSLEFIKKYGNKRNGPDDYIFDIYKPEMNEMEKFKKSGLFTRVLNENIKKLALANGLPEELSTYWSRHSFATNAIRGGASLEQISQALNHHDLATTKSYFAGFEDVTMKKLSDNLMNFD